MATVSSLGSTFNTTAGNKTVVATPAVNDLIVVVAGGTGTSEANAATTSVTDNNSSGTYYKLLDITRSGDGGNPRLSVWVRNSLVGSATSTTFTATMASTSGGGLQVFAVSGMSRVGLLAARRAVGDVGAAAATPAVSFITPIDTANAVIGAVMNITNPAGMTAPASWSESIDTGYATPSAGLETAFRNSGETTATPTWGGTSASAFRVVVVELDTRAAGAKTLAAIGAGG